MLSGLTEIPLIGLPSLKLSLINERWIAQKLDLAAALDALRNLMSKLSTGENSAKLQGLTHMGATSRNELR